MKIPVSHIPESGLEVREDLWPRELNVERPDITFLEPVHLAGRITKGISAFTVDVKIKGSMQLTCNRCLEESAVALEKRINLTLPEAGLEVIDLDEYVHDEIMLEYPLKALCRKDCRGLCPACGQNLNQNKCSCKVKE